MGTEHQIDLRDSILTLMLPFITDKRVDLFEAATACMGACATVIGALPAANREQVVDLLTENLLDHANKRAKQIHSGEVDRHFDN